MLTSKWLGLWSAMLKCWATGNPGVLSVIDRRCSATLSARRLLVSPTYIFLHFLQWMAYMQSLVVHENFLFSFQTDFGPLISVAGEMTPHVLHLGLLQGVPTELSEDSPSSERDGSEDFTSTCFSERSLRYEMRGGSEKVSLVVSSVEGYSNCLALL